MKLTLRHLLIFLAIAVLSVSFGFAYDGIALAVEKKNHPLVEAYAPLISEQAERFGVPEAIIWATVLNESDFVSSTRAPDGSVGLMQITPELLDRICREALREATPDAGMLYDPETNLRVGTAWLSALYERYGMWEPVYAAWYAGTNAADAWMADPDCLNEQGRLVNIPDKKAEAFVDRMIKASEMYTHLYYES